MTIKSSGQLSFTEITDEFGVASPVSLSNYYGLDAGIPNSGPIKFSNFYGKIINATRTIGTNQNYNAYSDLSNASVVGGYKSIATIVSNNLPVKLYVTVNGVIGSTSTTSTAFDTGTFPAGSSLYLINNNFIIGKGGNGGNTDGDAGGNGGPALTLLLSTFITNNGTIAGGGGGGGAGGYGYQNYCIPRSCFTQDCYTDTSNGGGGGGGAGYDAGNGGSGGNDGNSGTLVSGGAGGGGSNSGRAESGTGGSGGDLGSSGNGGTNGNGGNGGAGGSGGNYIVNSGYATWLVEGIRLGGVA